MNKSLLITRPSYDATTNYLYSWTKLVIDDAKKKQITIYDLKGQKATKENFYSYIYSKNPDIIFLNGHGNAHCITGQNDEVLLDESTEPNFFKGSIMYARSCDCGKSLGITLIDKRISAFIGYTRKYIIGTTRSKITKPLQDSLAKLFLQPSNLIPTTLMKGHTVHEADTRSKHAMLKNFQKMISSAGTFEERYAARWLWSNIKSQVVIGDKNASIIRQ